MRILFFTLAALGLASPLAIQAQTGLLNDTGTMWSGDASGGNTSFCDGAHPAGQDCHYGRDKDAADGNLNKIGGGNAGFDFTKVCNSGERAGHGACPADPSLGSGANEWACTRDNVTGLIWEVKVNDANHLRHQNHAYTWYNTDTATNGGAAGSAGNTNTCNNTLGAKECNTQNYVVAINTLTGADRLCGATDWRMPTIKELEGIADLGRHTPAIDTSYFPNTPSSAVWSGSPLAGYPNGAWLVYFSNGYASSYSRNYGKYVRLVRGGQ